MIVNRNCDTTPLPKAKPIRQPISMNSKRTSFYLVFFLAFCFSGLLSMLTLMRGGFQYRMGLAAALVIPLLLIYGIKIERVSVAYVVLAAVVLLSGLYNHSSLREIVLFMRILGFSYLMYRLVEIYIGPNNIVRVIRLCVALAMIQLPVVILQQLTYDHLPARVKTIVIPIDFDFGTFNFKGDASMTFFLVLLVIFLMFDKKRNHIIRHKWPVLLWLTLTVIVAHAEIVKIIIVLVWGIYLVRYFSLRTTIYSVAISLFIIGGLASVGLFDEIRSDLTRSLSAATRIDSSREEGYLSGDYGRGSAIGYYLNRDILWLGDGPSKYFEVLSSTRLRGNTGHVFTFYSEVGLFGWFASILVFFLISFPGRGWRVRANWVGLLSFLSIQILSFTTQIMNDIGVVFIYCIVAKSYLIDFHDDSSSPTVT